MIYATASASHYIPIRNLSTTHKHYTTNNDLCSTAKDIYKTYCNLSTAIDLLKRCPEKSSTPLTVLARPLHIPFDHTTTVGLPYSLTRHITIFPPTSTKPDRPDTNLWPTNTEPFDPAPVLAQPLRTLTSLLCAIIQVLCKFYLAIFVDEG